MPVEDILTVATDSDPSVLSGLETVISVLLVIYEPSTPGCAAWPEADASVTALHVEFVFEC